MIISCQRPSISCFYPIFPSHCHLPAKKKELLVLGDKSAHCPEEGGLRLHLDLVFSAPLSSCQQRAHSNLPCSLSVFPSPDPPRVSASYEVLVHCSSKLRCVRPFSSPFFSSLPFFLLSSFLPYLPLSLLPLSLPPFVSVSKVARNTSSQSQVTKRTF